MYDEGGRLPVWELWGNETDTMIGYHAVPEAGRSRMRKPDGKGGRYTGSMYNGQRKTDNWKMNAFKFDSPFSVVHSPFSIARAYRPC
jgi:hypothetical protein